MTLSTDMLVLDPTDVEALYAEANRLVAGDAEVKVNREPGEISNAYYDTPAEALANGAIYDRWPQPHAIRVNWDTSYSYRGPNGQSCNDLHAYYIVALGRWLSDRGIRWCWHNEYSGEWFDGVNGLETLSQAGAEAQDWFHAVAVPAIAAHIASRS